MGWPQIAVIALLAFFAVRELFRLAHYPDISSIGATIGWFIYVAAELAFALVLERGGFW